MQVDMILKKQNVNSEKMIELDLRSKIISKKPGIYFITKENKDKLKEVIQKLKDEKIFDKYGMNYMIKDRGSHISLTLYRQISFNV